MNMKPIHTEADYQAALQKIEEIFGAQPGTPKGDMLEILVTLVNEYEEKHFQIPLPDPIEAIRFHMERLGMNRKDIEPLIGNRARVSEVLNKKRPLSLRMIRNLNRGLGISTEILTQEYSTDMKDSDDEDPVETPTESPIPSEIGEFNLWIINPTAGSFIEPKMDNWIDKNNTPFSLEMTDNSSSHNSYQVEQDSIPCSNWPVYPVSESEKGPQNQSGTSHLQRI